MDVDGCDTVAGTDGYHDESSCTPEIDTGGQDHGERMNIHAWSLIPQRYRIQSGHAGRFLLRKKKKTFMFLQHCPSNANKEEV